MLKVVNEYMNEVLIGRVGKVEQTEKGVRLSIVENYDDKREGTQANWVNVSGFEKTAESLISLDSKGFLKGSVVVMGLNVKENGQYTNRNINWFKIVQFPAKKGTKVRLMPYFFCLKISITLHVSSNLIQLFYINTKEEA